jgi:hypothetical protein
MQFLLDHRTAVLRAAITGNLWLGRDAVIDRYPELGRRQRRVLANIVATQAESFGARPRSIEL